MNRLRLAAAFLASLPLLQPGAAAASRSPVSCVAAQTPVVLDISEEVGGKASLRIPLPAGDRSELLVQIIELGIDVEARVHSAGGVESGVADHPLSRQAVQRLIVRTGAGGVLEVRSVDHDSHRGRVRVVVTSMKSSAPLANCLASLRAFARADGLYAAAQQLAKGAGRASTAESPVRFRAAAEAYEAMTRPATADASIRAEAALAVAAISYYHLNRWSESARWAEIASVNFAVSGQDYLRARALALRAAAWLESRDAGGTFEQARAIFRELAEFHARRGEPYDEALQVNNLGLSYFNEARFEEAIPLLETARDSFARLGEVPRMALAVQNIALCEWGLGRLTRALALFDQALESMPPDWRPALYLLTLNNSGLANHAAGNLDKSLILHDRALRLAIRHNNTYHRARSLYGIGVTYYSIGDRALARQFLEEALALWTPDVDERGRVAALRSLAVIEHEAGRYPLADRYNTEALGLTRSVTSADRIRLKLAETALARGDLSSATASIEALANAPPKGNRLTQASARLARARLRRERGAFEGAAQDLAAALDIFRQYETLAEEFDTRVELAKLHAAAGRLDEALLAIDTALSSSDELRSQTANPEYRASVAATIRPALEFKMDLMRRRYDALDAARRGVEANALARDSLLFADSTRARAFDHYRLQRIDPRLDATLASLLEENESLHRELGGLRYFLATREDRAGPADSRAIALRSEIARLRVRLGVVNTRIADRTRHRIRQGASKQRQLPAFAASDAGVEYWLGSRTSYAWVVREGRIHWIRLQDGSAIDSAAREFHRTLVDFQRSPPRQRIAAAEALNRLVLDPLLPSLEGATRLVIVPDASLHFVPFAALHDGSRSLPYLVQRASISLTPALRLTPAEQRVAPSRGGRLLLVADPVYQSNDPRLSLGASPPTGSSGSEPWRLRGVEDIARLERLTSTAREADGVRKWFAASQVDNLIGRSAVRDRFLDRDLGQYQYIHVAAHGVIDGEIPQLSSLILGAYGDAGRVADQQIRVGDLLTKSLQARVVVLSACNTSLGPDYREEGPVGLRYAVLARGAESVVASLWRVADETNADLMTDMYRRMLGNGERVDTALAHAMRMLLVRNPDLDPALWAPYTAYLAERQER